VNAPQRSVASEKGWTTFALDFEAAHALRWGAVMNHFRLAIPSFAALALVAFAGCSSTVAMTPATTVPFAKGEIDPSFEDNGNGSMTLAVEHLGEPAKLASGATTYVVWIQPEKDDATWQNVGALQVDSEYSGEHTFSTTFPEFKVSVTAEQAADVLKPEGPVVLTAAVSK
jgi:hypothetical protein